MRRAISAAVAAVVLTGASASFASSTALVKDLLIPTPLGMIIKASNHFIERNKIKVYYVQVGSEGSNFEEAKNRALKAATEYAVGVVISSQQVVDNHQVVRDEIVAHSSGYVNDWRVVREHNQGGRVTATFDVWVSYVHLSERIVVKAEGTGEFHGGKLMDSRDSFQRQQQTGAQLLEQVLRDYPQRAMDVTVDQVTGYAEGHHVDVDLVISWNKKYVQDLAEAIRLTTRPMTNWGAGWRAGPNDRAVGVRVPGEFFTKWGAYDSTTFELFHQHFLKSPAEIKLTLRSESGDDLSTHCYELPTENFFPWDRQTARRTHFNIDGKGRVKLRASLRAQLSKRESYADFEQAVRNSRRVSVEVVKSGGC